MDIVRNNLNFFNELTKESDSLNISIKDNKIIQNDSSWLRNNSVDGDELYNVIVWTFDNAIINFYEHYVTDEWPNEIYNKKYQLIYDSFVSLNYVYEKCEENDYSKEIQEKMKEYDTELDQRLDIIYENCFDQCKPWEYFKAVIRHIFLDTDNDYECVDPDSDGIPPSPPKSTPPPPLNSPQKKDTRDKED